MAYQSGFIHQRITIRNKVLDGVGFGDTTQYEDVKTVWANIAFTKGMKAMHEGALDAYDTVMIRMRWNDVISRDSHIVHDGKEYQITSFHRDYRENQIQITAVEII